MLVICVVTKMAFCLYAGALVLHSLLGWDDHADGGRAGDHDGGRSRSSAGSPRWPTPTRSTRRS